MQDTVVVSTHLDDAVLSCYGMLSPSTVVVTVLAGLPPQGILGEWDRLGGATDSRLRVSERREEDRCALRLSGAEPVHLDFLDSQYVAAARTSAPSVEAIKSALRRYLGEAPAVFAPSALSARERFRWRRRRHSDHALIRAAVLAVRPDATLYADLPYALSARGAGFSLPAGVDPSNRMEHRFQLDDDLLAQKIESARCYQTQLAQLSDLFGDFMTQAGLGLEVWWGVVS